MGTTITTIVTIIRVHSKSLITLMSRTVITFPKGDVMSVTILIVMCFSYHIISYIKGFK